MSKFASLMRSEHPGEIMSFGVSPVNYSDSDSGEHVSLVVGRASDLDIERSWVPTLLGCHVGSISKACLLPKVLDPVVQSIVSLRISLRHKFVKQISAKVTNTLLFFVEKL